MTEPLTRPEHPEHCTPDEMMIVAAARMLQDGMVCFVGIGLPSAAAIVALETHARQLFIVYESGTLGPRPSYPPLSVADSILADTAQGIVSVPEIFNYWLQPGRIDIGLLGAAQVDRFANLNSTVIGNDYDRPKVRLPGAGGAPEIASACQNIVVVTRQSPRTFVQRVDFVTSVGHGDGAGTRRRLGLPGSGPQAVVTDIGVYEPTPPTHELQLTHLHPGASLEQARAATGWDLLTAAQIQRIAPPSTEELSVLRRLQAARGGLQ